MDNLKESENESKRMIEELEKKIQGLNFQIHQLKQNEQRNAQEKDKEIADLKNEYEQKLERANQKINEMKKQQTEILKVLGSVVMEESSDFVP